MQLVGTILLVAIQIFNLFMWGRLILDWLQVLAPTFRPRGVVLVLAELIFTVTDPPLNLVRRWVKPVRVGSVAIDLAWIVVIIGLTFCSFLVGRIFF